MTTTVEQVVYLGFPGVTWVQRVDGEGHMTDLVTHERHSPTGHSWGYLGSGPAQLALDLLWDATGIEPWSYTYQDFKTARLCSQSQHELLVVTRAEILDWLGDYQSHCILPALRTDS